jgi:hypothetical protein
MAESAHSEETLTRWDDCPTTTNATHELTFNFRFTYRHKQNHFGTFFASLFLSSRPPEWCSGKNSLHTAKVWRFLFPMKHLFLVSVCCLNSQQKKKQIIVYSVLFLTSSFDLKLCLWLQRVRVKLKVARRTTDGDRNREEREGEKRCFAWWHRHERFCKCLKA